MRSALKATLIGGCMALLAGGAAFATGGAGGMGGGSMQPSGRDGDLQSATSRYDPSTEYAKAIQALKANDYKAAAQAAEHVTEVVPKTVDGWRLLGVAKAGGHDWKGSRRAYEKAAKLAPDDPTVHAGLGLALANLKDSKAQAELDWLKAKTQACADTCADAPRLKSLNWWKTSRRCLPGSMRLMRNCRPLSKIASN